MIRNSDQVKQAIDFSGFENNKIHPSDIDAVLEFDNKAIIFIEVKREGIKLPTGQRLLLERLTDNSTFKHSITLLVSHNFKQDNLDIPLKSCKLVKCYYQGKWHNPSGNNNNDIIKTLNKLGESWGINKLRF